MWTECAGPGSWGCSVAATWFGLRVGPRKTQPLPTSPSQSAHPLPAAFLHCRLVPRPGRPWQPVLITPTPGLGTLSLKGEVVCSAPTPAGPWPCTAAHTAPAQQACPPWARASQCSGLSHAKVCGGHRGAVLAELGLGVTVYASNTGRTILLPKESPRSRHQSGQPVRPCKSGSLPDRLGESTSLESRTQPRQLEGPTTLASKTPTAHGCHLQRLLGLVSPVRRHACSISPSPVSADSQRDRTPSGG